MDPAILIIFCSLHPATGFQQRSLAKVCRGSKGLLVFGSPRAWGPSGEICQCQRHYGAQGKGQQYESAPEVRADAWLSLKIIESLQIF